MIVLAADPDTRTNHTTAAVTSTSRDVVDGTRTGRRPPSTTRVRRVTGRELAPQHPIAVVRCVVRVTSATPSPIMMEVIDPSAAPSPPGSRRRAALHRRHAINLCCAQSVSAMVEEIARQLRGLGFDVGVSCGARARAALLGGEAFTQRPTIHVVCVQGSMQERVLKPLRQALATHGGEGQHLFVAVLDLSVPLTMVGHIRRFAEALERTPAAPIRVRDHLGDRRRWREHFGHRELAERPTKSHPIVVDRLASGPRPTVRAAEQTRRGARTLATRSRPVRIVPTAKNRQVTAPQAIVDLHAPGDAARRSNRDLEIPPTGDRGAVSIARPAAPPRRIPAPSLRFPPPPAAATTPQLAPPVATHIGAVADAIVAAHEAVKAQVAETKQRVEAAVLADAAPPAGLYDSEVELRARPSVAIEIDARARPGVAIEIDARARKDPPPAEPARAPSLAEPAASPKMLASPAPAIEIHGRGTPSATPRVAFSSATEASAEIDVEEPPRRRMWPVALGLVLVGVGALGWSTRSAWLPAVATEGRVASPGPAGGDPAAPEPAALADARRGAPRAEDGADDGSDDGAGSHGDANAASPGGTGTRERPRGVKGSTPAGAVEAQLREAVARRRLLEVSGLYVTRRRGSATSWAEARARCNAFTFDGIDGWRLPWRRELKLIGVSTRMDAGTYWSHSVADGQRHAAWAWDTSARKLAVAPKESTAAEVVCVKPQAR